MCPSGQHPTLLELLTRRLPEHISARYKIFGTLLLNDKTGAHVDAIVARNHGDPKVIVRDILKEWLQTHRDPTWKILVKALNDIDFNALAKDIEDEIKGLVYK